MDTEGINRPMPFRVKSFELSQIFQIEDLERWLNEEDGYELKSIEPFSNREFLFVLEKKTTNKARGTID